jgi:anti-sigma factor (TIGR02949 family)
LITCKDFLKELNSFLDEETNSELREQLNGHLTECPNCWVVMDTTRKTLQIYKGMDPQDVPVEVSQRLMDALSKRMAEKRARGC